MLGSEKPAAKYLGRLENFVQKLSNWAGSHLDKMDTTLMTFHLYVFPIYFFAILFFPLNCVLGQVWAGGDAVYHPLSRNPLSFKR